MKVNRRRLLSLLGMSPALLAGTRLEAEPRKKEVHASAASDPKITAVSPKGSPPAVQLYPMATRATSLDGKTLYLVDATSFDGGATMLKKMQVWFQQNMPTVKTVFRTKSGQYASDDPQLWAEIKANAYATIMAIGH